MVFLRRTSIVVVVQLMLSMVTICAQEKPKELPIPEVPMQQWLAGADHTDLPAEFKILNPRLTYQQRHLVECRASISGEIARGRELHIWLNVADNSGKWFEGSAHVRNDASPSLTRQNEVQWDGGFYASPGQYKVAIVIYDAKSHQYDVRHLSVTVKPIENDPLASHVESSASAVEFFSDPPSSSKTFQKISDFKKDEPDSLWPFARSLDAYPLKSTRPLEIDVVLNFSDSGEAFEIPPQAPLPRQRRDGSIFPPVIQAPQNPIAQQQQRQKEYIASLLSAAQVLAAIRPSNGCVRISAIDIGDMQPAMLRVAPETVEWEKLRTYWTTGKQAEVSLKALKNRKEQPVFVRDFLMGLQAPIEHCGTGSEPPMHAVIFVSHSYVFPGGSHKESFRLADPAGLRFYYYKLDVVAKGTYDDLGPFLKSGGAKSHDLYQPRDLRDAMARTFNEIVPLPKK